jgi:hypothetical protein
MNLTPTRFGGYLSQPLRADLHRLQIMAAGAGVWGFALLPGGLTLGICGFVVAVICSAFRWTHRFVQHAYLTQYGAVPPPVKLSPRWRRARSVVLILAVLTLGDVPGMVISAISWPIARSYFNTSPMCDSPFHFRWFGCTIVWSVETTPSGVTITAIGGGESFYPYIPERDWLGLQGPISGRLTLAYIWMFVGGPFHRLL